MNFSYKLNGGTAQIVPASTLTTTPQASANNLTTFTYDSSDRNTSITQGVNKVVYTRDVQDRIVNRTINYNGAAASSNDYGFTGASDTPDIMKNSSGTIMEKYFQLPGNVMLAMRPTAGTTEAKQMYSLPNIHGDIMATTTTSGTLSGTFLTGPFGEKLTTTTPVNGQTVSGQPATPGNAYGYTTFQYVGQNEKFTEDSFAIQPIQMGARVYIPTLGRFLQVDPQEGGTPNNYVYVTDPVNDFDLSGNFGLKNFAAIASVGAMIPGPIGMISSAAAVVAYTAAGDKRNATIMAAGIALAAVGAGGAVVAAKAMKSAEPLAGIAANAVKGARTEKKALALARISHPFSKIQTHAYENVPGLGRRFIDIKITSRISGRVTAIEVKAGNSRYHQLQQRKDEFWRFR